MHTERHTRFAEPNRWLIVQMPTVLRVAGYRVMIYGTKREHGPPHVHVTNANGEVITLATAGKGQTVRQYVGMREKEVATAFDIVADHAEFLMRRWRSFHD
ncbi:MAG: DUF4160 domain-containing protein [Gemmatimonadaceae bacterium]